MRRSHVDGRGGRRTPAVLLGGAVLIAGAAFAHVTAGNNPPAKAEIAGPALAAPPADEVAAFQALPTAAATDPVATAPVMPTVPPPALAAPLPAKPAAAVSKIFDLDRVSRVDDHYEVPLADGKKAILTLDPVLQEAAEKLLVESRAPKGAIVAMAPDGRILALAGRKAAEQKGSADGTFDPHLATEAWAPAASVFKLVTASALVAAGVDPDDKIKFHGGVRSVMQSNLSDDRTDNATASLAFGVAHSNNAILGKLAYQHLDPGKLAKQAHDMGLDATYALVPAVGGSLALPEAHDLEFAKSAAGFVGTDLSAIGGAELAAIFADGGEQPTPYMIDHIVAQNGAIEQPTEAHEGHRVIAAEVAKTVGRMMVQTCDVGSAAKSFHRAKVRVAGKTGTLTRTEPFYMEHSWFVGFAPVDKPSIVVSVVLGNSENWHLRGQEAAKRLIDTALSTRPHAKDRGTSRGTTRDNLSRRNQW